MAAFLAGYAALLRGLGRVERAVAIVMLAVMVVCIFAQVVSRYLFGQPLVWVEELSTYAFIWGAFIGASAGLKAGLHLKIESFVGRLPPGARRGLRAVLDLLMIAFCAVLLVNGFRAMMIFEWSQRTIALPVELPRYLFYSTPLILASASMLLTLAHDLLEALAGREPPRRADGPVAPGMTLALLFVSFLVLIALEMPIAFALGLASMSYLLAEGRTPLVIMVQRMTSGLDSFPFLALPLFVLAGHVFSTGGIARRIYDFARALVGHFRGGLAHVNVVGSMIFAGMSGTAQADAAGLGVIEIEEMKRDGFDPAFAGAVTATSAIIGPIIPPSVIMVIFAVMTEISVARLFLGGFIPGILMGLSLMGMIYWLVVTGRVYAPTLPRQSGPELWRAFRGAFPALVAPIFLIGGMVIGVATPTELGAIVVVYGVALGFVYRELTLRSLVDILGRSALTYGVLVFIISAAFPFGWLVAINQVPATLVRWILSVTSETWLVLLLINVVLLIAGCFMETTAILVISVPVFFPLIRALGVDPVHFGIVMVINLLIGTCTPPFGIALFITMQIAQVSFARIVRAVLPFLIPLLVTLLLVTFIPQLVLFLPNWLQP